MMAEPDVALTDYALVLESFLFSAWIYRLRPANSLRPWFVLMFGSIGLAALVGGTVHGFLTDPHSRLTRICWLITMIILGMTALSEYGLAARILFPPRSASVVTPAAFLMFAAYTAIVVAWSDTFRIAVVNYMIGLLFLAAGFLRLYAGNRSRAALIGLAGLLLTVGASVVQQARISIHPHYFNHNALYHLLEAVALFLIYISARSLVCTTMQLENR